MKQIILSLSAALLVGCVSTQKYAELDSRMQANRVVMESQKVDLDTLKRENRRLKREVLALTQDTVRFSRRLKNLQDDYGAVKDSDSEKDIQKNRMKAEYEDVLMRKDAYIRELAVQKQIREKDIKDMEIALSGYITSAFGSGRDIILSQSESMVMVELPNKRLFVGSSMTSSGAAFIDDVSMYINSNSLVSLSLESNQDVFSTKEVVKAAQGLASKQVDIIKREQELGHRELTLADREAKVAAAELLLADSLASVTVAADDVKQAPSLELELEEASALLDVVEGVDVDKRWYLGSAAGFVIAERMFTKGVERQKIRVLVSTNYDSDTTTLRFVLDSQYIINILNSIINN